MTAGGPGHPGLRSPPPEQELDLDLDSLLLGDLSSLDRLESASDGVGIPSSQLSSLLPSIVDRLESLPPAVITRIVSCLVPSDNLGVAGSRAAEEFVAKVLWRSLHVRTGGKGKRKAATLAVIQWTNSK